MNNNDLEIRQLLSTENYELSPDNYKLIESLAKEVSYRKGEIVIKEGTVNDNIYIVKEGILRGVLTPGKKETTVYFAVRGDMLLSLFSYQRGLPAEIRLETCCDSVLLRISKKKIQKLTRESLEFSNWMLELATEQLFLIIRKRTIIAGDAYERYESFVKKRPELLQKVPLKIIASYLGITQPSLSRLRHPKYKDTPENCSVDSVKIK